MKRNAKVQEANNATYSMNTILECDNNCDSKLNLTNLVVRLKLKLDKILTLNNSQTNDFVVEFLVKLIHLILSKHKCSPMCNELSLILIRNYFKQLHLPSDVSTDNSYATNQMQAVEIFKKKLNLHLNEAHSCSSLVSLNHLTDINVNKQILSNDSSAKSLEKVKYNFKSFP